MNNNKWTVSYSTEGDVFLPDPVEDDKETTGFNELVVFDDKETAAKVASILNLDAHHHILKRKMCDLRFAFGVIIGGIGQVAYEMAVAHLRSVPAGLAVMTITDVLLGFIFVQAVIKK